MEPQQPSGTVIPFIKASENIPETTIKAILLGIILAVVLAGSNAYLGLKMGQTISASIPAAVISMAVLRFFRNSTILENNIVQTIASAGEVVAASTIFTIPALLVLQYWQTLDYWQITLIAVIGGVLGVLFSVPLRRALIVDGGLQFPEGVATAEVLKAGSNKDQSHTSGGAGLLLGGAIGASILKFFQSGFQLLSESISGWFKVGGTVFGFSNGLSLAMVGAGYIVGLKVAINLFIGALIAWGIIVPLYAYFGGPETFGLDASASAEAFAMAIKGAKIRYIGVGTMVFGGIYAIVNLVKPIKAAVTSSFVAMKLARQGISEKPIRTEHDIPMTWVVGGTLMLSIPIMLLFNHVLGAADLPLSAFTYGFTLVFLTVASLVIGFICASIGGYMAGIVGSSANPLSGITIGAILLVSFSLLTILGNEITFGVASKEVLSLAAVVIFIGGVVAAAASLSCDNLQDLKSGQLVGATPWKQQLTLIIGVVAGAAVVAPILQLLFDAYGIGGVFPREGMDPSKALAAPQATLMASVAQGIFEHKLDWALVMIGIGIGLGIVLIDRLILAPRASEYRLSALAVALGIYLPMDVILPIVIGGTLSYCARHSLKKKVAQESNEQQENAFSTAERKGLLFSAGMIAGDAMIGIVLAIPFAAYQSTSVFALVDESFSQTAAILGTLSFAAVGYILYNLGSKRHVA
ncbi:MAG: oligopeptide transporter, OPT family [Candidatus Paracaedibacteraceae bacterium]|nr:oligopeptide transporter, OPT family [Candidatus Paracaedibacteraceae bacterium]